MTSRTRQAFLCSCVAPAVFVNRKKYSDFFSCSALTQKNQNGDTILRQFFDESSEKSRSLQRICAVKAAAAALHGKSEFVPYYLRVSSSTHTNKSYKTMIIVKLSLF